MQALCRQYKHCAREALLAQYIGASIVKHGVFPGGNPLHGIENQKGTRVAPEEKIYLALLNGRGEGGPGMR